MGRRTWRIGRIACALAAIALGAIGFTGCDAATYTDMYFGTDVGVGFTVDADATTDASTADAGRDAGTSATAAPAD